jgi:hypothetical protein
VASRPRTSTRKETLIFPTLIRSVTVVRRSRMHCSRRAVGMELHGQPAGFGEIGTGSFITQPRAYCQALSNPATPATRQGGSGSSVGHVGPRRPKFPSLEPGAWPGLQEVAARYCARCGHSRSPPNKFCLVGADLERRPLLVSGFFRLSQPCAPSFATPHQRSGSTRGSRPMKQAPAARAA